MTVWNVRAASKVSQACLQHGQSTAMPQASTKCIGSTPSWPMHSADMRATHLRPDYGSTPHLWRVPERGWCVHRWSVPGGQRRLCPGCLAGGISFTSPHIQQHVHSTSSSCCLQVPGPANWWFEGSTRVVPMDLHGGMREFRCAAAGQAAASYLVCWRFLQQTQRPQHCTMMPIQAALFCGMDASTLMLRVCAWLRFAGLAHGPAQRRCASPTSALDTAATAGASAAWGLAMTRVHHALRQLRVSSRRTLESALQQSMPRPRQLGCHHCCSAPPYCLGRLTTALVTRSPTAGPSHYFGCNGELWDPTSRVSVDWGWAGYRQGALATATTLLHCGLWHGKLHQGKQRRRSPA
jgi:hypothetical protein